MPISGMIGPSGILKLRGAFGIFLRRINTSMCAKMYVIIQKTEPTKIKNSIISEEPSEIYANRNMETEIRMTPIYGQPRLLVLAKICGSMFIKSDDFEFDPSSVPPRYIC